MELESKTNICSIGGESVVTVREAEAGFGSVSDGYMGQQVLQAEGHKKGRAKEGHTYMVRELLVVTQSQPVVKELPLSALYTSNKLINYTLHLQ